MWTYSVCFLLPGSFISAVLWGFICAAAGIIISFLSVAEWYSIVYAHAYCILSCVCWRTLSFFRSVWIMRLWVLCPILLQFLTQQWDFWILFCIQALRRHQTFARYIPTISHILLRACYFSPPLLNCVLGDGETRTLLIALADLELSMKTKQA